ncbi:MAG: 3-oxoacyl-ACP reductase [Sphingomonadales bacterium]|nr:3-oxoacyl-ACP reductase [Sphingomonadales bacterium]
MNRGIGGKVAIVFGASRGLGRAVAEQLGSNGCRVVVVARSIVRLEETVEAMQRVGADAWPVACDITSRASIKDMIASVRRDVGSPDIVVYNNGGPADSSFDTASDEEFMEGYMSQVMGFVWAVREVVPDMKARGWGRLVTLGSMAAKEPHREMPMVIHNVTRPAALGLSKSLSVELAPFGITVNTIGTGLIDGGDDNSFRKTVRGQAEMLGVGFDELLASRLRTVPVGRGGRPDEVGSLCAFLCSQDAGFITGQLIVLDGGKVRSLF